MPSITITLVLSTMMSSYTVCKFGKFGPVTSEFNIAKDVHPVVSFFKIS